MMDAIRHSRRSFLGAAAAGVATAGMARMGTVLANTSDAQGFSQRFAPVRQIRAGVLDIGYYETGSADGPPVLLLHGFPYSVDSYVEVAPMLAEHGCRVIVPYLRGHGSTHFLDGGTPRSGQQGAIGVDVIALMDALGVKPRCACRL